MSAKAPGRQEALHLGDENELAVDGLPVSFQSRPGLGFDIGGSVIKNDNFNTAYMQATKDRQTTDPEGRRTGRPRAADNDMCKNARE